jgi:hypothetical protein
MSQLDDYHRLLRQVEDLKRKRDKALGARDQLLKRLKKEYKVKTLDEGKKLLDEYLEAEIKASEEYTKLYKEFLKNLKGKWRKQLELEGFKFEGLEKQGG